MARRRGSRAEIASLRVKLARASAEGDAEGERAAAGALARALVVGGAELDTATKLARRALMLGDDPALREELSSWFAALGEPGLAAATLRSLAEVETGERLGRVYIRIAVFLGRHGEARAAADALASASRESPDDPVAAELRGAIGAWAPEAVTSQEASDAYLEAARRREATGDRAGAFEDLLRAFEIAPDHPSAAQRLAGDLAARGRAGAAEEVLREHARALGDEKGVATHRARLRDAIVDGDPVRALSAAFDAGLHLSFDAHAIARSASSSSDSAADLVTFDRLLADASLHEVVAARLELAAEALTGAERARARVAQGRVCAGPVGNVDRAVEAWIDALAAQPSNEEAKSRLREHAVASGDYAPLVEALVRAGMREGSSVGTDRATCLRELVVLADQRLSDPSLALWAVRRLLSDNQRDDELRSIGIRLSQRARQADEVLAAARVQLAAARPEARVEALRQLSAALRGRPDESDEYARTLQELVHEAPEERAYRVSLERVLSRLGRALTTESLWQHDLERKLPKSQHERARLGLSSLARARGDVMAAIEALTPLVEDGAVCRAGWAMLFALAAAAGRSSLHAEALRRIASTVSPQLSALLSSVASDVLLAQGDRASARRAAEQACHADSSSPRAIAALARATSGQRDRIAAVALERAAGVVLPRASLCRALAETYDALGEPSSAMAWTQRGLALRPGDRELAGALLERVTSAGDPARIADALAWLLSQPEPLTDLVPLVCRAVCRLAELEPTRGAALARRALDVFGPRIRELRDAVLAAADSVGERGLGVAVLERQLASGAPGADRAEMLLDLARRRRHAGDADGAARSLVRALAEGADPAAVLGELDVALPARGSDGELSLLEGRAEALSALSSADMPGAASAWRELGAARWDLADDREGAIGAWERGAALDGESGLERLARDLVAFAGHAEAVHRLEGIATRRRNRADVARALAAAAGVALDGGLTAEALALAVRSLEADSSRADVLGIAERAAGDGDVEQLERAYDIVARGALGMYGERAAHYRASRQLERRGFRDRALRHAIVAFEAVPAEGVTFVLMMRLAERTGDPTEAVQAIERVAAGSRGAEERSVWLRRAALVAGSGEQGKRQRVEVLLRALDASPHGETLRALTTALSELVRTMPEEKDVAELRFTRALKALLPRLEGPDGARIAVGGALTALVTFGTTDMAFAGLLRAADSDASIDEFTSVIPEVAHLSRDEERARGFVEHVITLTLSPHANVGPPLVALGEAMARAANDAGATARLLAAAVRRDTEDLALLRRAEEAARAHGDAALLAAVLAAVPVEQRVATLSERADAAIDRGDLGAAISAVEEARRIERLPPGARAGLTRRLRALHRDANRTDELEMLLREELAGDDPPEERTERGRELATLLADQGRAEDAVAAMVATLTLAPKNRDLLSELLVHALAANDARRQIEALSQLVELTPERQARLALLRKLAPLLASEGDEAGALSRFREIVSLDERDAPALNALTRDAERRSDWDALSELLSRRAALPLGPEDARQVRLHRAEVLEQRLGRSHDARLELEALLAEKGDHLLVLTRLADLNERLGARLRAAPLWLRASALPKDRSEAGELSRKACQAYVDGGDVESARRVFSEMGEYPRTPKLVALRVDIARRSENPEALSEALEELALSSMDPPKVRSALLVEAARAALSAHRSALALGQAQRAARIAREAAEPQLLARLLEYRLRGAGTREEAAATLPELRAIRGTLAPADRELQAFLLAEALDVAGGEGEAMRELSRVHAELGSAPLIALGMAERLAKGPEPERSLDLFDAALGGDLRELRRRGEVALSAAAAAQKGGLQERALEYLEIAAAMPDTRARALGAQTELRAAMGRIREAPPMDDGRNASRPASDVPSRPGSRPFGELPSRPSGSPESGALDEEPVLELRSRRTVELPELVLELRRPSDRPIELRRPSQASRLEPSLRPGGAETPDASAPRPASLRASAPPKPPKQSLAPSGTTLARGSATERPATLPLAQTAVPTSAPPRPSLSPKPQRQEAFFRESSAAASGVPAATASPSLPAPPVAAPPVAAPPAAAPTDPPGASGVPARTAVEAPSGDTLALPVPPAAAPSVAPRTDSAASVAAAPPEPPPAPPAPAAPLAAAPAPHLGNEDTLLAALARGSVEAGKELVAELERRPDRTHDLVNACRRVAHLLPGDRVVLEQLYDATLADRNIVYARAVEHVLRAFDPKAAPLEPPSLAEQIEQPDRVHSVVFRDTSSPATEALGLVWNGAPHMFRRDPASYGVTGLERVAPSAPSPLARQFGAASRVLGMTRTALFQRRSGEPVTVNVALLSPPALLLTGEVKAESAALGFHLGAMLAATMPEHVLLYGAPEAQVDNVLRALLAAFGPPQEGRGHLAAVKTLAEMLWESMPARSQRRLRELCSDASRIDYSLARIAARQAVRRAGLFVSGDLTVAVRETCAELGVSTWGLDAPGGLSALCSASPAVADLVRLATSPEYAATRWQQVRGGGRQPGSA